MQDSFYNYQKLETPSSFRLLKINFPFHGRNASCHYSLIETTFDQKPHYEALSYVWGTTERNETVILDDNQLLRITKPLKEALAFVERQCTTGFLWIDQICIDQDDRSERGHQVKLMGMIYSYCTRVLVWLGQMSNPDPELSPTEDLGNIELPKTLLVSKNSLGGDLLQRFRKVIGSGESSAGDFWLEILRSPWFQRAWIFQEIVLPRSAMFILATTSTLPNQARTISLYELLEKVEGRDGPNAPVKNIRIMYLRHVEQHRENYQVYSPIEQTLSHLSPRAKTSEQLDRLYAFFGLNLDPYINLTPSYDSSLEVAMIDTATAIIEGTCSLDLFEVIPRAVENTKRKVEIPTWTPDFREERLVVPFSRSKIDFRQRAREAPELYPVLIPTHITYYRTTYRGSIYCAGEEKRTIQAHGYVLDHIETEIGTLSYRTATETHLNALLERCIEAWNKTKRDAEHKVHPAWRHKHRHTESAGSTVDLGLAPKPEMATLREALVAEGCYILGYDLYQPYPKEFPDILPDEEYSMVQLMCGRTLWMTRSGRFAVGSYLRRRDNICIAYGCSNPIALRGEQMMKVLGTCFLQGWMDPWSNGSIERIQEKAAPTVFHIV